MTDNSAWYQRALARARGQEAPRPQPQPAQVWNGTVTYPTNTNGNTYYTYAPQTQPQTPVRQEPAPPPTGQKQESVSTTQLLQMQEATGRATPGEGARLNPDPCPNCGAALFFEDLSGKKRRGPPPAPHCFTCGYNGLFEQGQASSWGA